MARLPDPELADLRRRQILDAALACFRRRGFHQASMQEICREAGLSAGALYRYFPSKTELIAAICEDERAQLLEALCALESCNSEAEAVASVIEATLHRVRAFGGSLLADVIAETSRNDALREALVPEDRVWKSRLMALIAAGQAAGRISPDLRAEDAAGIIENYLDGLILRVAVSDGPLSQDVRAQTLLLINRLFAPATPADPAAPAKRKYAQALAQGELSHVD